MRLDQHMDGQGRQAAEVALQCNGLQGALQLRQVVYFWNDQICQFAAAANGFYIVGKKSAVRLVDARANAVELIFAAFDQSGDQIRVSRFVAEGRAIFTVESNIKQRVRSSHRFLLQNHGFTHQLFGAGIMVANRQGDWD